MRFIVSALSCALIVVALPAAPALSQSAETVRVGGGNSVLLRPKAARGSIILMPGGHGSIGAAAGGQITQLQGNQLVRTRNAYVARGKAALVLDASSSLPAAVTYMAQISRPVTVVATSRGTQRAAQGIAAGARPDALVLTAGFLSQESGAGPNVMSILGSPSALLRTMVIHHRGDTCRFTLPAGVDPFIRWAGGRARVAWLTGGRNQGDPCEAAGHHGFAGLDGQVVGLASGFR